MDSKNKNFDDIRRLSKSIEVKKNILDKYLNYFDNESIDFIEKSISLKDKFDNEIKEQEPNIDLYYNKFITINNILNSFINYLKEQNLYISETMNKKFKYKLKESEDNIKTTMTGVDPETGAVSWDIKYNADFGYVYKLFKKLHDEYRKFIHHEGAEGDPTLEDLSIDLDSLYNKFRTHLRKNYPDKYRVLSQLKEEEFKASLFKKIKETSVTGGGATFTPGEGPQYATKYAFRLPKKKDLKENNENDDQFVKSLRLSDEKLEEFIRKRLEGFNDIENKLNELLPLLKNAKQETLKFYKENPKYTILYGTDIAVDYLNDLIKLFTNPENKSANDTSTAL